LFERNKDRSTEDVLAWLKQVYEETLKKLDATSFEDLLMTRYDDDPEKRPLLIWVIANTNGHFAEHRATLERIL